MTQISSAIKIRVETLNFYYNTKQALFDISMQIPERQVTAFIGPSGCGKSTFLRCLNRMNDQIPNTHATGKIWLDQLDTYAPTTDVVELRRRVGLVFQKPNPFPQSVYENVALAPRSLGLAGGARLETLVIDSIKRVGLWEAIDGNLRLPAQNLSLGEQQRLCIARTLAVQPEVILMDEPCSALDPIATLKIEDLMHELSRDYTIVIVTHNMQQAARVSSHTALFWLGKLVEFGETPQIFTKPQEELTEAYISGRMG